MKKILLLLAMVACTFIACSSDKEVTREGQYINFGGYYGEEPSIVNATIIFDSFDEGIVTRFRYAPDGSAHSASPFTLDPSLIPYIAERFRETFYYELETKDAYSAFKFDKDRYVLIYNY